MRKANLYQRFATGRQVRNGKDNAMNATLRPRKWWAGMVLACTVLCGFTAHAGIPHPGIILYGKVFDENGAEVNAGELVFTYTPEAGGAGTTLSTTLRTIEGNGGPYAYRLIVPFEIGIPEEAVSGDALPLPEGTAAYVRAGSLEGTPVAMSHVVDVNAADASNVFRVDVCIGCNATTPVKHATDINFDYHFSLSELLRTIELHTATPDHEYHVDAAGRDGYNPGAGSDDGTAHSADYDGGSNWKLDGREVVRVIDLFSSTAEHAYDVDPTSPDGFKKSISGPVAALSDMLGDMEIINGVITKRIVSGGDVGAPAGALNIQVTVVGSAEGPISGLGTTDELPAEWTFTGLLGQGPAIHPKAGASGALDFVSFPVPALPYTFAYSVQTSGGDLTSQFSAYAASGYYRLKQGNDEKSMQVTSAVSLGDQDTDGDGIPDAIEGVGDIDGDGIPNFLDVDGDNDGLSDHQEVMLDGNPEYNPYDSVNNPNGTDGDINNPDTNGNGRPDGVDFTEGNPVVPTPKTLPLAGGLGLAVLAATIVAAAARRRN